MLERPSGLGEIARDIDAQTALAEALHLSYLGVLALAILAFATTWLIPIRQEAGRTAPAE
jgi:hypothetical protein